MPILGDNCNNTNEDEALITCCIFTEKGLTSTLKAIDGIKNLLNG